MKYFLLSIASLGSTMLCGLFAQQNEDVLFYIGDEAITKKDALYTLGMPANRQTEFNTKTFNTLLNYYLSIHDFKDRGADTMKVFKRKLEVQTFNILGNIYSAENHSKIMNKCTSERNTYAIVQDLFVPFDPMLLRGIEELRENVTTTFEDVSEYALAYEGTHTGQRLITPLELTWTLTKATCELIAEDNKQPFIGPVKDIKGYHYLKLIKEQPNFGTYRTQLIFVSEDKSQIDKAYKSLKSGDDFDAVAQQYSELYSEDADSKEVFFSPSITINEKIVVALGKLKEDGQFTEPFAASEGWYIIKRLGWDTYPVKKDVKSKALRMSRKPSFFKEELKEQYNVKEYPHHFLSGRDEILFLVKNKPYYTKDLENYASDYGYDITTDTYDKFLNSLLVAEYKKELDESRYKRLLDDFYFMQIYNPINSYKDKNIEDKARQDLKRLIAKYNPIIPNKKYVENNPVFEK